MQDDAITVLFVCGPTSQLNERLPAILPESEYAIRTTPDTDSGGALAQEQAFDLIVFEHPASGSGIHEFLKALRWSGSPCHGSAIVILTPPDLLEEAEEMLVAGIGRILNLYAPDAFLARAIRDTLDPDRRLPIKALVRIPGEDLGLRGTLMIQTDNLSASGMMVRCDKAVPYGARFSFSLELPGLTGPVQGTASVVRFAKSGAERITGFAARFLSFVGDGEKRLQGFVEQETRRQRMQAKTPG